MVNPGIIDKPLNTNRKGRLIWWNMNSKMMNVSFICTRCIGINISLSTLNILISKLIRSIVNDIGNGISTKLDTV